MNHQPTDVPPHTSGERRLRADAQRSIDAIVAAARELFATTGVRLRPAARKLYEAAVAADEARADMDAAEILCAVSTLCMSTYDGKPDHAVQMTALLVEGLRLQR